MDDGRQTFWGWALDQLFVLEVRGVTAACISSQMRKITQTRSFSPIIATYRALIAFYWPPCEQRKHSNKKHLNANDCKVLAAAQGGQSCLVGAAQRSMKCWCRGFKQELRNWRHKPLTLKSAVTKKWLEMVPQLVGIGDIWTVPTRAEVRNLPAKV